MLLLAIGGRADASTNDVSGTYEVLDTTQTSPAWSAPTPIGADVPGYYEPALTWYDSQTTGRVLMFSSSATLSYTGSSGWRTLSPPLMPTPRDATGAAIGLSGRAYVIGGAIGGAFGTPTGTVEAYDATANKWTTGLATMPTPRSFIAAASAKDGLIYAIGGRSTGSPSVVGTTEAYDPSTDRWMTLSELPDPATEVAAVGAPDGRIYVIGGSNDAGLLSEVNAFSRMTNRWTPVEPIDSARYGVGAVVAPDGRIWAIGGGTNPAFEGVTTVQIYGPVGSVSPAAAAPGTTVSVTGSNFAANANVNVYMGPISGTALGTGTTNAAGTIASPIRFNVPNLSAGSQTLIVIDDRSQYPVTLSFRVQ